MFVHMTFVWKENFRTAVDVDFAAVVELERVLITPIMNTTSVSMNQICFIKALLIRGRKLVGLAFDIISVYTI